MRRVVAAGIGLLAAVAAEAAAQAPPEFSTATVYHGREGDTAVDIPRISAPPTVDGRLDETVWQSAAVLTGFSQYTPIDGLPAEDSTEVLVLYAPDAIFFGIRAFEPHGAVNATLADRDRVTGDDHVFLILDTFNDRRRALLFLTNPFGVQGDGTFADATGTDLSPDFLFESRGRVTEFGYEVEVRIPFKSLRYQAESVQTWGFNVIRKVQHSGQEQSWTPLQRGHPSLLGQSGTLVGLSGLRRGLVLDVNPVMTARAIGGPRSATDPSWRYDRQDPEFGGNVRWGVTSNLTMNATVNPDFSQVESDVGQVTYDPRNSLFFPEKRPFFLEGSESFSVPNQLIYTRRIADPIAAAKMSGKGGSFDVGVLSAVDDESLSLTQEHRPVFNILRLRRDLGAQSNLGIVYTDRIDGDDFNRVAGFDTRLLLGRYIVSAQLASSFTSIAGESSHWRPLWDFGLSRTGRDWGFNVTLEGTHPEFVAGSGFVSRTGIAHANISPRRTFFPQNSIFESISTSLILDGTWDYDRFRRGTEPNDMKLQTSTNFSLRGGWRATLFTWLESFMYPADLYAGFMLEQRDASGAVVDTVPYTGTHRLPNYGGLVSFGTPQFQTFSANGEIVAGHDVNFDEWSSAWIFFTTFNADWRPTEKVRVNARYVEQRFYRTSDGSLVRVRMIPRLKLEYQLARPIFLRFVGQYDALKRDALRDDSRTNAPILRAAPDGTLQPIPAVEVGGFRADWLFSYQPNPGTVVFAGYGTSLVAPDFFDPRALERSSDGFFVKVSYLFRL